MCAGLAFTVAFNQLPIFNCMPCAQLCLTPRDFSVHGIFQAGILEWIAISSSRGSSLAQGANRHLLCLLYCRWILHPLSHFNYQRVDKKSRFPAFGFTSSNDKYESELRKCSPLSRACGLCISSHHPLFLLLSACLWHLQFFWASRSMGLRSLC